MDDRYTPIISEEERAARHAQRAAARKRKLRARRRRQLQRALPALAVGLLLVTFLGAQAFKKEPEEVIPMTPLVPAAVPEPEAPYSVTHTADTLELGESIDSDYAVLIDLQSDTVLARKAADAVINPASMTKILTVLVAAEQDPNLNDTFTITREITDYCFVNDCSVVGLDVDETVSVRELFYGTILSSGADASLGLAIYTAGSHEAFVELMNAKAKELGLSDAAHFTNCVGLYNKDHHCTVTDMALILKAAMENDLCREVLSAHIYETAPTPAHPDGQILSNWFLRKIEDHDKDQSVRAVGAKTGYVVQSGNCAASWGENTDGDRYLCVTGSATSSWGAIRDHVALYKQYCE